MKTIKVTIKRGLRKPKELTIREGKTGYPYLKDYRAMKAALSEFRRCRMEEEKDA